MNAEQRQQLQSYCPTVTWDVDMGTFSTFRAGGTAEAVVEVTTEEDLQVLLPWLTREHIAWQVIGGGSNILVATHRFSGVFIRLHSTVKEARLLEHQGEQSVARVWAPAGCSMAALVNWCTSNSLDGLTFMAGIPGSVGGAVRMNAGACQHAIGERVHMVRVIDAEGNAREIGCNEITFGYRFTSLPHEKIYPLVITGVLLHLLHGEQRVIGENCQELIAERKKRQPQGVASAGSFFKNPAGDFAGRLIEDAGLKGLCQGKAMVSPEHANFIVNTGGASPDDILLLMEKVQQAVQQRSGVLLEPEVRIL